MRKSGFIRKALIMLGLAWLWFHFFLSGSQFIQSGHLRRVARVAVVAIAVWGVLALLSHRVGPRD